MPNAVFTNLKSKHKINNILTGGIIMEELLIIKRLKENAEPPYHLLYTADPSKVAVEDYISRGKCYVAYNDKKELVGSYVLLQTRPFIIELINLAVEEKFQKKGNGRKLVEHAINEARILGYEVLEICTGNSSLRQLGIYQRAGFSINSIDLDFFRRHYSESIWEDGIECRHLISLRIGLV